MKHNGQNIITDRDIEMTGNGFQGEELSGVLSDHQTRLDMLESNVKWIYKNGGVGSGGSGDGGGSSTSWKIVVSRGDTGQVLTDNTEVSFAEKGNYFIKVQIYRGGTSTFRVKYNWKNTNGAQTRTAIVSKDNSFSTSQQLLLDENGSISITVLNQDTQEPIVFNIPYIVTPYKFSLYYVYSDTKTEFKSSGGNIFMSDVRDRGIMAALSYNISVDLQSSSFTFTDWEGILHDSSTMGEDYEIKQRTSGIIYLDLTSNITSYLNDNANAKFIQFSLNIDLTLAGNVDKEKIDTLYLRDNLIPSGMYLKVQTLGGGLYSTSQLEHGTDPDTGEPIIINNYPENERFSVGNGVFQVTPYYNALHPSRTYSIVVKLNDVKQDITTTTLLDQQTRSISVPLTTGGQEYKITFKIQAEDQSYEKDYYLYVKEATSNFTWYPESVGDGLFASYYRQSIETVGIPNLNFEQPIRMSINSNDRTLNFTTQTPSDLSGLDQLLCIGIQLSSINDVSEKIATFRCDLDNGTIDIYQNKLVLHLGSSVEYTTDIYIPTVHTLNENGEYHLISIYKNFESREGSNYWKRLYIYIDGILESAISQATTVHYRFEGLTLFKGNYIVNLIECSYFNHQDGAATTTWLSHNDILKFYYTYKEKVLRDDIENPEKELALLDNFGQFKITNDDHVTVPDEAIIENIAENSDIPILVLDHSDISGGSEFITPGGYGVDNFKNWMDKRYSESSGGRLEKIEVTARWRGKGESVLREIVTPDNNPARFKITPQGSSTLGYHCKNWELFAPDSNSEQTTYVYTPNFVPGNFDTFLPEESFTLKADVVDSSHTNNNAIGDFVNYVTTPFAKARPNNPSATEEEKTFNKYIKNCLTGFPVLVFVISRYKSNPAVTETDKKNIYFLGIYNFNLGRQSYYNLGYKNVTNFSKYGLTSGFHIYEISNFDNALLNGVGVAEIQGNGPMFDFSQYDSSILFKLIDSDEHYMFGDLVSGTTESTLKEKLQSLLRKTSRAGGYTFTAAGKLLKDTKSPEDIYGYGYDEGYSAVDPETGIPNNQVPNYKYQAKREYSGTSEVYEFSEIQGGDATEKDLTDLIFGDTNIEAPEYGPTLDYKSLCEYYTVCMAFGLVDSVQKNLNIKTWDVGNDIPLWYLAFYDMDTCLGVSNSGEKISYFAFSDYWKSNISSDGSLLQATVYRDYSPKSEDQEDSGFYDIASSYIFAVAKYAYTVLKNEEFILHPSNLWGIWRNSSTNPDQNPQIGCLSDADQFMNNFYIHHLKDVPLAAFNYNYAYKYFVKEGSSGKVLNNTDFAKFYGRKIYYTKNWLEGRLHLLDAYFNINRLTDTLAPGLEAPYTDPNYRDNNNPDIYVLKDIFSSGSQGQGQQYSNLNSIVRIRTRPYSPLILSSPNGGSRYIFPETGEDCLVKFETYGNQYLLLGGSSLWESISSINPFITRGGSIFITSDFFTELTGDRGTCSQWNLKIPSIKTIKLTSRNYSGNLEFKPDGSEESNPYPNLNSIDISGTSIRLTVDSSNLTTLTAKNMVGGDIAIINTSTLTKVDLSGSNLNTVSIPAWSNNIVLNNLNCTKLEILENSNFPTINVTISNNTKLETLSVANAKTLTVSNCVNLKEVGFKENGVIEQINITSSNPDTFKIYTLGTSVEEGVVDLSNQRALTSIVLRNTQVSKLILPPVNINFPASAFRNCKKLEYIDGNGWYYITGNYTFYNCEKFTLKQSDGLSWANIKISSNVTSLGSTFAVDYNVTSTGYTRGSLDLSAAERFLDVCCDVENNKVENVDYLFYNQNIEYSFSTMLSEYKDGKCSLNFKKLPNITSMIETFFDNPIYAYNRYLFQGLTKENIKIQYLIGVNTGREWTEKSGTNNIVYITEDFLYEIIEKLSDFRGVLNDIASLCFCVINPEDGEKLEIARLENIFNPVSEEIRRYPVKLSVLSNIEIDNKQKIDFSDVFKSTWTKATTTGMYIYGFFTRYSYPNVVDGSLNGLFVNITLIELSYSLGQIGTGATGHQSRVNLRNFINWDRIGYCKNLFVSVNNPLDYLSSINFLKEVSKTDFWYIWRKLLTEFNPSGSFVGLGYLFSNCNINYWLDDNKFSLVDPNDTNDLCNTHIENIPSLFDNCRVFRETGDNSALPLFMTYDSDLLKALPNISTAYRAFRNTFWKNTIPFDFFQKRKEQRIGVYVENSDGEKVSATKYTYIYSKTLIDLRECFSNIHLELPHGFSSTEAYNCGKLDLNAPECMITRVIGDEDGLSYNEYYLTDTSPESIHLDIPTEELDLLNLEGTYSSSIRLVKAGASQLNNPISSTVTEDLLFVSPDVFRGCSQNCLITSAFNNNISQDSDNPDGSFAFTGIIPDHLLETVKTAYITNMLKWLNIIPRYIGSITNNGVEEKFYRYVPSNFTNNTSLANSFNFKLILPSNNQHFYIFLHDSIPAATERLTNSLPSASIDATRLFDVGYKPWTTGFNSIQYHIMGTILTDPVTNEFDGVSSGIDLQIFNKLKLDELVSFSLASVLAGDLFLNFPSPSDWKGSKYLEIKNADGVPTSYVIRLGYNSYGGLSYACKLTLPIKNDHFAYGVSNYVGGSVINEDSVINYSELQPLDKLTYEERNIQFYENNG